MQLADFLSAVFFYLKVGENLNQNWIVENLNNAFSTWNGKLGELWGLVTTGPQTFKGGAVWSVMQTLHNGMVGIGYALVVLFFAISLCKNTMNFHELKRPEAAIHYFLRFVAAKALVGYGMLISYRWGDAWTPPLPEVAVILLIVISSVILAVHGPIKRIRNMSIVDTISAQ